MYTRIASCQRLVSLVLAAIAMIMATSVSGTSARADDLPFWEKADQVAAAKSKKSASYKSSKKYYASAKKKKSYASKSSKKLGGYAEASEPVKKKHKGVRVASLGNDAYDYAPKKKKSLSGGGGVTWTASSGCLDSTLASVVRQVAANYGSVTVNSTCRNKGHNRAVGGAPHSKHLSGDAVDFRVHGNVGAVLAYLKSSGSVGGLKHYGGGLFHIDNGDRRSW